MLSPGSKFWIIDDDLSFGKSLRRMLNARGLPAEYFGSAQSFLDSVPQGERGCAIVDVHMPDVDGLMLTESMRQDPALAATTVIMLTSGDRAEDAAQCERLNIASYLLKPVKQSELLGGSGARPGDGRTLSPRIQWRTAPAHRPREGAGGGARPDDL